MKNYMNLALSSAITNIPRKLGFKCFLDKNMTFF